MNRRMAAATSTVDREDDSQWTSTIDFRKLMAMAGALYWLVTTVVVVPIACTATAVMLFPLMLFSMKLFNKLEHALCVMVNDHWVGSGQYTGVTIEVYGDDINTIADKRALCLVNHLGLVDHYCLMTAFHDKHSLTGRYLWVIFNIWKKTPLGVMWTTHGNFFINGGAAMRDRVLKSFREHLAKYYWRHDFGWVVMYPEGSRLFLIKDSEQRFAAKNGIAPFKHCAHPRTGAAHAVLDVAGPSDNSLTDAKSGLGEPIEYIVDVTLGYPKGNVVSLGDAMVGEWPDNDSRIAMHYRIFKVTPELTDEPTLKEWLYERYAEKDQLLDDYYRTGVFPGPSKFVNFPQMRNVIVQFFWLSLFYLHYVFWIQPVTLYAASFFF
uniref:PlsC domain-containing protein n=1 Tax=Panagrellus redivivus TaxID=6233 RepID=A0A7E4VI63_PANRE